MTDLELIDLYCENCIEFIDPRLFREIEQRGLYEIINNLPYTNPKERKYVARARLSQQKGVYTGDVEIEQIASVVNRMDFLRKRLNEANLANVHLTIPLLSEMMELSSQIKDYFK